MITYNVDGVKMPKIKKRDTSAWIRKVAASHGRKVGEIGYMFVDDEKILEVNNEYLGHDYYTDVITFDYDEDDDIGIVIMTQILVVHFENLLVIYKHIANLTHLAAMRGSYLANPGTGVALLDLWHFHAIYIVCYHTLLPPIFILFLVKIHLLLFRRTSIPSPALS